MIPVRDTIPCARTPYVTWVLIAINFIVFLFLQFIPEQSTNYILHMFGMVPIRFSHPELAQLYGYPNNNYLPFLTCMFLHASWMHVLLNMWMLWIFGDNIEDVMGTARFIIFFLICGLVATTVHLLYNPESTIPTVGASGALAGILGAYFFLFPYARIVIWIPILLLPIFIQVPAIAFLGVWVIFQLHEATTAVLIEQTHLDVAWWGHLGGFVSGAILFRFFVDTQKVQELRES